MSGFDPSGAGARAIATPPRQVFLSVPGPNVDYVSWRIPGPYPLFRQYGDFITVFRDPDGKPVGVLIREIKYITKAARDVLRIDIKAGTPLGTLFAFACLSLDADEKVRALAGIPELLEDVLLPEADWGRGARDASAL